MSEQAFLAARRGEAQNEGLEGCCGLGLPLAASCVPTAWCPSRGHGGMAVGWVVVAAPTPQPRQQEPTRVVYSSIFPSWLPAHLGWSWQAACRESWGHIQAGALQGKARLFRGDLMEPHPTGAWEVLQASRMGFSRLLVGAPSRGRRTRGALAAAPPAPAALGQLQGAALSPGCVSSAGLVPSLLASPPTALTRATGATAESLELPRWRLPWHSFPLRCVRAALS